MKPRRKVTWTAPAEVLAAKAEEKAAIRRLPIASLEPKLTEEGKIFWETISVGSPLFFKLDCWLNSISGFPYPVARPADAYLDRRSDRWVSKNVMAIYVGTTPVKARGPSFTTTWERAYRTILVGSKLCLLDDPNVVYAV
jgi:hypothetical protein